MTETKNGKYTINDSYFDQIDTEDKAYFLGLLYADGCNYENGTIKIDLVEEDAYILEKMCEYMKCNRPLSHYKAETKIIDGKSYDCQPSCRFLIKCNHISKTLNDYGVIPHKSEKGLYIKDGIIPDELFHHWVRGLIDGDGGISYWTDNIETKHKKFQIHFCSTTDIVMNLASFFRDKFACKPTIDTRYPDRDNNNLQFSICGNQVVRRILDWLYKDATIYLKRKYKKYQELIDENERKANNKTLYGSMKPRRKIIYKPTGYVYESLSDAERATGINRGVICNQAKRHKGNWLYFDELENNKIDELLKTQIATITLNTIDLTEH